MGQNRNSEQFLVKKAYEICYALFRITAHVKRESFARRLEELGLDLLESIPRGAHKESLGAMDSLDRLIGFGADIGFIHQANSETTRQEISNLNSAIAGMSNSAKTEEVNLSDVFSHDLLPARNDKQEHAATEMFDDIKALVEEGKEVVSSLENGNGRNGNGNHNVVKTVMRQSAILDRIRQNGNCRLKEIQEILPTVSERTIRYDLQRLLEQGMVQRIGNGGPATHYRIAG